MKKLNLNAYIADELANKVVVLTEALSDAKNLISQLEKENVDLKKILDGVSEQSSKEISSHF